MLVEVALLVILLVALWNYNKRPSNYPPGFWGLPLVGYLPLTEKSALETVYEARNTHGDTILWRIGQKYMLFLFDFPTLKKVLSSTEGADRTDTLFSRLLNRGNGHYGVIATNGEHWQNLRRFLIRQLREFGMGKSLLINSIQNEVRILLKEMEKVSGTPGPLPECLKISLMNISWLLVTNQRFDVNDARLASFQTTVDTFLKSVSKPLIIDFYPWIKKILPKSMVDKIFMAEHKAATQSVYRLFQEVIDEHKQNLDRDDPKDIIDVYLMEMEKEKKDQTWELSDDDLFDTVADLYLGSSETQVTSIRWALLYLAAHPEVQTRLQEELDRVFPGDITPDADNQSGLHYTRAVLAETHRLANIFPSGVWRAISQETTIDGYFIPKGTILPSMTEFFHKNPKYWKNPDDYKPERHLNESGEYVQPKEGFLPFGIGKRVCLGEAIARMEMIASLPC